MYYANDNCCSDLFYVVCYGQIIDFFAGMKLANTKFRPESFNKKFKLKNEDVLKLMTGSKTLKDDIDEKLIGIAQVEMLADSYDPPRLDAKFTPIAKLVSFYLCSLLTDI